MIVSGIDIKNPRHPMSSVGRSLTLDETRFFFSNGYVHLDSLWDDEFTLALEDEARNCWAFAKLPEKGPRTPVVKNSASKGGTLAATGPLLTNLHLSLVGIVRALTGRLLVPTFSAYGYYQANDKTLLHIDKENCDITLLTKALGEVGPLHLHPELKGMTMEELGELEGDSSWDHASGLPIVYPSRGLTAITGNILPHNRPGKRIDKLSAVAALCYRSLF
jgi:hypothetical protein